LPYLDHQIASGGKESDSPLKKRGTLNSAGFASLTQSHPMDLKGVGRVFQRGSDWWIAFYHRGKEIRQSSRCESEAQARKLLKKRFGERSAGRFIPDEERVTFDDLVTDLKNDYQVNGKRSLKRSATIH
jgi:hypothetical protein